MTPKHIAFNPEDFVSSVEAVAAHVTGSKKPGLRTKTVQVFKPAPELTAKEIQDIRAGLGVSQIVFASMLNVPVVTAISWEKGRRSPSGAALRLLELARTHPEILTASAV
jgi:putative transcriptional regulator